MNILEGARAPRHRPPRVRLDQLGLRRQHARCRSRETRRHRPPGLALRRHQEGQRADGAFVRAPLRHSLHGAALLHRLRAVGPPGHGALQVHPGHPRGRADPGLQRRPDGPRLHLRGRHRRGRRARDGPTRRARPALGRRRPIAATSPAPWRVFNIGNNQRVRADALHRGHREGAGPQGEARPAADAGRATCRRPRRTPRRWMPPRGSSRPRRWRRASSASSSGTGSITGSRSSCDRWALCFCWPFRL